MAQAHRKAGGHKSIYRVKPDGKAPNAGTLQRRANAIIRKIKESPITTKSKTMEKEVYKSKVDAWIVALVFAATVLPAIPAFTTGTGYAGAVICLLLFPAICASLFGVRYEVGNGVLTVSTCHLFREVYYIENMKSIRRTRCPLSAPAASLDRIEIKMHKGHALLLSPRHRDRFVRSLLAADPGIRVDWELEA